MIPHVLEIRDLCKSYGDYQLGPLDLVLDRGKVLGLIGPNGAGKTTLLHSIINIVLPDEGQISLFGKTNDPNDVSWKEKIGLVTDDPVFYENWSGGRNLNFVAQLYPTWDDDFALRLAHQLDYDLSKKAKDLSRGNRIKLSLIMALAHRPKLCLFDEPTSGLDPLIRSEVLEVLDEMVEQGETSILYSTHILSDVERLADELAFLVNGEIRAWEDKKTIHDKWEYLHINHHVPIVNLEGQICFGRNGTDQIILSSDSVVTSNALRGMGVEVIKQSKPTLEEIALSIIKEEKFI